MNLIGHTLICLVFWEFHKMHIVRPIKWNGSQSHYCLLDKYIYSAFSHPYS